MDTQQPSPEKQYHQRSLADFMALAPAAFIDQAYLTILRREPDPVGRNHFLAALCSSALSRAEILDALRQSHEGSSQGVVINGLQAHLQRQRLLSGIPLLGRLLRLVRRIAQLPSFGLLVADLLQHQQAVQSHLGALSEQHQQLSEQHQQLSEQNQQLSEQNQQSAERQYRAEVRLGILEAGVNSIRLETRRTVAEYRRYLLALEPKTLSPVYPPAVSPQAASCGFGNSIYAGFEDEFRGSSEQVRQGLAPYLPLVREVVRQQPGLPVIDLGCGRGEWLELLTEERIPVKGADLNPVVVTPLAERGYDVACADLFSFMAAQADASAAAVSSFHLIEHLPPEQWIPLLDEILRILAPGGLAIIETPNPRNILVGAGDFYRDPSHHTPVFPDTLSYLGRVRGFDDSMAYYFDERRSRLVPSESWCFDTLDDYVRISRDYAWTGRKNK